jgi:hypothetical protein
LNSGKAAHYRPKQGFEQPELRPHPRPGDEPADGKPVTKWDKTPAVAAITLAT